MRRHVAGLSDHDREKWINNHEPLFDAWQAAKRKQGGRMKLTTYITQNRVFIDDIIAQELERRRKENANAKA